MYPDQPFEIKLTSLLPIGDLVANLTIEGGGQQRIVLRNGQYTGTLSGRVVHLQLTAQPVPPGESQLNNPDDESAAMEPLAGAVSSIEELFENGIAVSGGRVELQLLWGLHCHRPVNVHPHSEEPGGESNASPERAIRFGSFEHIRCAELVGTDATGKMLNFAGVRAAFHYKTKLPVGKMQLTFGEIISLAGDYYAYLDQPAAQTLSAAWPAPSATVRLLAGDYRQPALRDEDPAVTHDILKTTYRDKSASQDKLTEAKTLIHDGLFGKYPVRRYLALASQNFCHFACQPPTGFLDDEANEALKSYRAYHKRALALAEQARAEQNENLFLDALVIDAFGCHFLTDLFSTGHMRVPRRVLSERYGIVRGALGLAHEMHCEDNKHGLWCTTRLPQMPRMVWQGFGDTWLLTDKSVRHFNLVKQAVRRSAAEVFARWCSVVLPVAEGAEALIPVPLAAGSGPESTDVYPTGGGLSEVPAGAPNHYPLLCFVPEHDLIVRRVGTPQENLYEDPSAKKGTSFALSFASNYPSIISLPSAT